MTSLSTCHLFFCLGNLGVGNCSRLLLLFLDDVHGRPTVDALFQQNDGSECASRCSSFCKAVYSLLRRHHIMYSVISSQTIPIICHYLPPSAVKPCPFGGCLNNNHPPESQCPRLPLGSGSIQRDFGVVWLSRSPFCDPRQSGICYSLPSFVLRSVERTFALSCSVLQQPKMCRLHSEARMGSFTL